MFMESKCSVLKKFVVKILNWHSKESIDFISFLSLWNCSRLKESALLFNFASSDWLFLLGGINNATDHAITEPVNVIFDLNHVFFNSNVYFWYRLYYKSIVWEKKTNVCWKGKMSKTFYQWTIPTFQIFWSWRTSYN